MPLRAFPEGKADSADVLDDSEMAMPTTARQSLADRWLKSLQNQRNRARRSLQLPALRGIVMPYGIAILAVALALALSLALASVLAGEASYLFFLPAILIASALGGWGPGLFATVLGLLLGLFFVADFRSVSTADIVNAVAFTLVGVGASWRGELLHRSRLAAAANAEAAIRARGPSQVDSRQHPRRHDRHR